MRRRRGLPSSDEAKRSRQMPIRAQPGRVSLPHSTIWYTCGFLMCIRTQRESLDNRRWLVTGCDPLTGQQCCEWWSDLPSSAASLAGLEIILISDRHGHRPTSNLPPQWHGVRAKRLYGRSVRNELFGSAFLIEVADSKIECGLEISDDVVCVHIAPSTPTVEHPYRHSSQL